MAAPHPWWHRLSIACYHEIGMALRTLREQLLASLRTDPDLDAFCLDYFPEVHQRFSKGMDRVEKINLLLTLIDEAEVVRKLAESVRGSGHAAPSRPERTVMPTTTTPPSQFHGSATTPIKPIELTFGHVKAACALLTTADAQGTGYLIRHDQMITCAHVVSSVGIGGRVQAQFADPVQVVEATVERIDEVADWALLRLPTPLRSIPLLPSLGQAVTDSRWLAFGYPALAGTHGLVLGGVVRDSSGKDSRGRLAVQLFCDEAAAAQGAVLGGASGSPVISGGQVIGHLRRVIPDEGDRAQFGTVFACPTRAYEAVVPRPATAQQLQPRSPKVQYDPLWYIPRPEAELLALNKLRDPGVPVTLQAPEGFGKNWMVLHLLDRIAQQDLATGHKTAVIRFNVRKAVKSAPVSLEKLLSELLRVTREQLRRASIGLPLHPGHEPFGDAMSDFRLAFQEQVLEQVPGRLLLILDEADHLHGMEGVETPFFAGLRAMAEDTTPAYERLRLVVTIGAEAGFLENTNHSAFFALSAPIVLKGFSLEQLRSEAVLCGLSADDPGLRELLRLTAGHPFYARLAIHEAVCRETTLDATLSATDARGGVFASSLQQLRMYVDREGLMPALNGLLQSPRYKLSADQYLRLYRKGLVVETDPGKYHMGCRLFESYFRALFP